MSDENKVQEAPKRLPTVAAVLVAKIGESVIVQYTAGKRSVRVMVPKDAYAERMPKATLEAGVPMSVPWADILTPTVTSQMIEDTLYGHGIWTKKDWRTKPRQVMSALQILVSDLLDQVRRAMQNYGGE